MTADGSTADDTTSAIGPNEDLRLVNGEIAFGINSDGLTLRIRPSVSAMKVSRVGRIQIEHVLRQIVEAGNLVLSNGPGAGESREFVLFLKTQKNEPTEAPAQTTEKASKAWKQAAGVLRSRDATFCERMLAEALMELANAVSPGKKPAGA